MTGHTIEHGAGHEPWQDEPEEEHGTLLEVVVTIGAALLLAFLVQQFLVKPFKIPSGSMENTLRCGDRVLVDRLSYRFSDPSRVDVIVFHPPAGIGEGGRPDPSIVADRLDGTAPRTNSDGTLPTTEADTNYIKRIVGLPGDKVEVKRHKAYVNGKQLKEPYLRPLEDVAGLDSTGGTSDWGPQ
ncbi:MAG: signal peptidase, partial [Thermoleophilia bacterium]|nr:signal peptidase [Thermoleophilia bacterium]